ELVSFENHVSLCPNSASLFHCRSPFLVRFERVDPWERIASRGRPAFSSHLISPDCVFDASLVPETCPNGFADSRRLTNKFPESRVTGNIVFGTISLVRKAR